MNVSVIISTYNRPNALARALSGLCDQMRTGDEVIVADDGSKPPTREMVEGFQQAFPCPLKYVWQPDKGFRAARIRNKAIRLSTCEYIILLDGDCIPNRFFIRDHVSMMTPGCFVQGSRILVGQRLSKSFDHTKIESPWQLIQTLCTFQLSNGHHLMRVPFWPVRKTTGLRGIRSCNMAFFRKDMIKVNGFNQDFEGWGREDSELAVRFFAAGLKRKEHPFKAICFHLWHRANDRSRLDINNQILQKVIASKAYECANGLIQIPRRAGMNVPAFAVGPERTIWDAVGLGAVMAWFRSIRLEAEHWLFLAFYAAFFSMPLGTSPSLICGLVGVAIWLATGMAFTDSNVYRQRWMRPVYLFALLPLVGLIYTPDLHGLGIKFAQKTYYWVFCLAIASLTASRVSRVQLIHAFLFGLGVNAVIGLLQFVGIAPEVKSAHRGLGIGYNTLSVYLVVGILTVSYHFKRQTQVRQLVGWGGLMLLFFLHLIIVQGRAGYLAFFVLSPILVANLAKRMGFWKVGLTCLVLLGLIWASPVVRQRTQLTIQQIKYHMTADSDVAWGQVYTKQQDRFYMYRGALRLYMQNPIIGVGTGGYQTALQTLGDSESPPIAHPHSNLFHMMVSYGIFGLVAFGWLFWVLIRNSWQERNTLLGGFILSGALTILASGMVNTHILDFGTAFLLVMCVGLQNGLTKFEGVRDEYTHLQPALPGGTWPADMPISAAIITKDEAQRLPQCVKSLSFVDEVVVVDAHSDDETVAIARALGCRVIEQPWLGFARQKQLAVESCKNDWVLIMDADERMPSSDIQTMAAALMQSNGHYAAFSLLRRNHFRERWIKQCGWWPDRVVRLVDRRRGQLSDHLVHEQWVSHGAVKNLEVAIDHFSYASYEDMLKKMQTYSSLAAQEMASKGKRVFWWSPVSHGIWMFVRSYLLRFGWLEGFDGLVISMVNGGVSFWKYAKLRELKQVGEHLSEAKDSKIKMSSISSSEEFQR